MCLCEYGCCYRRRISEGVRGLGGAMLGCLARHSISLPFRSIHDYLLNEAGSEHACAPRSRFLNKHERST